MTANRKGRIESEVDSNDKRRRTSRQNRKRGRSQGEIGKPELKKEDKTKQRKVNDESPGRKTGGRIEVESQAQAR